MADGMIMDITATVTGSAKAIAGNQWQGTGGRDFNRARRCNHHNGPPPPGNLGGRFSRCDATPSRTSAPLKPSISSASEVSKVGPAMRSQLLRLYLVQRMADWEPSSRRCAISRAL